MKNRTTGEYESEKAIFVFRGIISYLMKRKREFGGVLLVIFCLILCSGLSFAEDYIIVDKNYPAPFTGVLMDLQYLQKITKNIQEKEKLEIENKVLKLQIQEITMQYNQKVREIERSYWKTTGGFILGLVVAIGTVFILNKYVIQTGGVNAYPNNNSNYNFSSYVFSLPDL